MAGKELRHSLSVLAVTGHAHMQAFQTEVEHIGVDGALHTAEVPHQLGGAFGDEGPAHAEPLGVGDAVVAVVRGGQAGELVGVGHPVKSAAVHNGAAHAAAVTVHVFGGGMGDDVGAPLQRAAVDGGGKGVVHDERHVMAVGCGGKTLNVQHGQRRVSDGLTENGLGVGLEGRVQFLVTGVGGDKGGGNAHLGHGHGNQVEGAAVDGGRRYDVIPRVADVEQRKEVGSLPGAGQHAGGAALQLGDLGGHMVAGGIGQTGIKVAVRLQIKQLAHLIGAVILKSSALDNGDLPRLAVAGRVTALYTDGVAGKHGICHERILLKLQNSTYIVIVPCFAR